MMHVAPRAAMWLNCIYGLFTPRFYLLLTYMATIERMIATKILHPFELPSWEGRLPLWPLYVSDDFSKWARAKKELDDPLFARGGRSLREHLTQAFCDFRCSRRPPAGDLRRMTPNSRGIWKMHPVGLRIYGWCPALRSFAVVAGALESETKANRSLNDQRLRDVLTFINANGLGDSVIIGDILAVFPP